MKTRNWLLWILSIIITLGSAYYQRLTGPTHPYRGKAVLGNTEISYKLIRSFPRPTDAPVKITVEDPEVKGYFKFKRFPSNDEWQEMQLERDNDMLIAYIPQQPPAGKVTYQIFLEKGDHLATLSPEPITIRFRGDVPAWALIPHVIFMFLAMLFSMRTGLAAIFADRTFRLSLFTSIFLVVGGLILGPIVQKYAFGDYWTGWPFGTDLTDNKTAVAFVFWMIALYKTWKNPYHRAWALAASIVLFIVYMIPHSLLGSEIDFTQESPDQQGQITGMISYLSSRFNLTVF